MGRNSKYTVDYFIEKFKSIPSNKWTEGYFSNSKGQYCALGHCGEHETGTTDEARALRRLGFNWSINDSGYVYTPTKYSPFSRIEFNGKCSRTRVLNWLKWLKKQEK